MTFSKARIAATCAAIAVLGASAAHAQVGPYIEGGYSYLDVEPERANDSVQTSAITARLGFAFSPMLSAEVDVSTGIDDGEFDFNVDEDEFNIDDNGDADFLDTIAGVGDIQLNYLVAAYAKAGIPISEQFHVHARAGYAYIDLDAAARSTTGNRSIPIASGSEDGFRITENLSVRGDYTWFGFDQADTQAGTITVGYKF
jgi:outer membrane immunogenic protein